MTPDDWLTRTSTSYDEVAVSYAEMLGHYPDGEPYDRAVLALFAELVREAGGGRVVDVGCGPGHVTAHLRGLGLEASGLDVSPGMIAVARRNHPLLRFEVGSMTCLELPDCSVAGLLLWYSLIHVPDEEVPRVLSHAARVLRPGGVVLIGFQVGDERRHKTEGYGDHPMDLRVHYRPVEQVSSWLVDAGLVVEAELVQGPRDEVPDGRVLARLPHSVHRTGGS